MTGGRETGFVGGAQPSVFSGGIFAKFMTTHAVETGVSVLHRQLPLLLVNIYNVHITRMTRGCECSNGMSCCTGPSPPFN